MRTNVIPLIFLFSVSLLFNTCKKEKENTDVVSIPYAPSGLSAIPDSQTQINLTWSDNSTNETGFKIESSANNITWIEIANISSNTTSFQHTGLTASTTYYYKVRAYNSAGNSDYTPTVNATTQASAASGPNPPTNLSASAVSNTQINLSWTDNSNNETGFKVERSPDGNNGWAEIVSLGSNVTSYENTGLTASTTYYYRVRAYNAGGNSSYTSPVNATTNTALPSNPTNLTANASSTSQINLAWTDNADNEQGYKVERAPGGTSNFEEITSLGANTTSYSNTGLTEGTTYIYRVRAYNTGGNSSYSNTATATTNSAQIVPTISAPSTSTGTFTITMSYPFTSGGIVSTSDGYYLYESATSPTSGFTLVKSITNSRVTSWATTLTKATGTYYYKVRVYDRFGYSDYSIVISVSVNVPAAKATLHIVNNTHYDMIDIRLNGSQYVTTGLAVLVGNSYNVEYNSSGTVTYNLGVGFWDGSSRNVWFYLSGTTSVTVGGTTNLTFNNPTIGQLLAGFGSSKNWNGYYFDINSNYHTAGYNFTSSGNWTFYNDGSPNGSGSVTLVSWPNYAIIVTFKTCSACEAIQLPYPFGSFLYRNGPANWPIIEYTGQ